MCIAPTSTPCQGEEGFNRQWPSAFSSIRLPQPVFALTHACFSFFSSSCLNISEFTTAREAVIPHVGSIMPITQVLPKSALEHTGPTRSAFLWKRARKLTNGRDYIPTVLKWWFHATLLIIVAILLVLTERTLQNSGNFENLGISKSPTTRNLVDFGYVPHEASDGRNASLRPRDSEPSTAARGATTTSSYVTETTWTETFTSTYRGSQPESSVLCSLCSCLWSLERHS